MTELYYFRGLIIAMIEMSSKIYACGCSLQHYL